MQRARARVGVLRAVLRRSAGASRTCAEVAAMLAAVWYVGQRAHAFTGFPKGYDATGHLSKAQFIASNFPHISWNYEWYSGQPTFAGSYPPGYHVLLVAVSWIANVSLPTAMNVVTFACVALVVVGLYAIVRAATSSRLAALLAAGLLIAAPTLWSQNVVLGLYPRFTALAFVAPAMATAVVHAKRGGRLSALGTVALLGVALSMHPIVGALGIVLVAGVIVLGGHDVATRLVVAGAVVAAALTLTAYFYLPLGLQSRSQSLFTNSEVPLTWRALGSPSVHSLDAVTPMVVPLAVVVAAIAAWLYRKPRVSHASKVALGTDVLLLSEPPLTGPLPATATAEVASYVRWFRRRAAVGYPLRLCLFFAALVPWFFAYGLIGYVDKEFPYYINGLQPSDLLIYPAFLCCAVVGLGAGAGLARVSELWRRRPERARRARASIGRATAGVAVAGAMVAAIALPLSILLPLIAPATSINDDAPQIARRAVFPSQANGQRDFRVAGTGDSVTKWLNEYSDAPQDRGYDDHGALHFGWQNWLEQTLTHTSYTPEQRDFLLDWYAVKWIDTDTGASDTRQYDDTSRFSLLARETNYAILSSYLYDRAKPIVSVSTAPTVLVIGDATHYDLLLRALSYADVGSDELIPIQGPTSVDDVNAAELSHFDTVMLYGAGVRNATRDANLLADYVRAGGGLTVDAADDQTAMRRLAGAKSGPLPVKTARDVQLKGPGWAWTAIFGDPLLAGVNLDAFGAASYAGQNRWSVFAAQELQAWGRSVAQSYGVDVLVSGQLGLGRVVWSGLGLPYHVDSFASAAESAFLAKLILTPARKHAPTVQPFTAQFVDAQHRRVNAAAGTGGVLLKEQDAPDWQARIDGRRAAVYSAGPGMMWIPLPDDGRPHVVDVEYRLSTVETLGYVVSALAMTALLALALSGRLWRRCAVFLDVLLSGGGSLFDVKRSARHRQGCGPVGAEPDHAASEIASPAGR